jgi:quinol monooxygenase YgiN
MWSSYESQATFDRHFGTPEYAEFQATLKAEDIIDFKDPVEAAIRVVKRVTGFM